jgi:ABC-type Mn2+/Zn2+ transport system permease subunit
LGGWISELNFPAALVVAACVGAACAGLSPLVVARRWAFAAEGIAHSGLGGAGTVWFLAAFVPALREPRLVPVAVVAGALLAAAGMVLVSRRRETGFDVAVGAVLAATLAWGFVGREVYRQIVGVEPGGFAALLVGRLDVATWAEAAGALLVATLVLGTLVLLARPIRAFMLDPALAATSGVPERALHYGLMLLVAAAVALGVRVTGTLLVTALLVLPGATAARFVTRPTPALLLSLAIGITACLAAVLAGRLWPWLPTGPTVVLTLCVGFAASLLKR